jgi:NDP-sugar pyrophosphorylase family protein
MPVAGTPIIARILQWIRRAGIRRVVLNLHHRPETITAIVGDGSQFGLEVRYSWEQEVLGSAGGPRHALPLLDAETFFIINGDTLTDCDLTAVARRHQDRQAQVTMAVVDGDVQRYGGVLVDRNESVRCFGKPDPALQAYHFIGVQAANAAVFATLPDNEPSETVRMLYPRLIAAGTGTIGVYHSAAEFLDVGTARDYLQTVAIVGERERRPYDVGVDCQIAADATIERSIVWDRVVIGRGARVVNSILADDVIVSAGARVENQVLVRADSDSVYSVAL